MAYNKTVVFDKSDKDLMYKSSVKTSKLEDQYVIIFSLALWLQEPHEVHFFKKTGFHKKWSSENAKNHTNLHEMGPGWR